MSILIIRGFIDNIKKLLIKTEFKKSVQEKLFTDKKLTFEEYTTLLEIVTENLEIVLIVIMENSTLFLENEL